MFKLNPTPTFKAKVPLTVPGLPEPLAISVVFRHLNRKALASWLAKAPGRADAEIMHEVIESWSGVFNDEGREVPYDFTALTALLENYGAANGEFLRAFLSELTEAKRKN